MASDHHHPDVSPLLGPDDPSPATIMNPAGRSQFLFIGDHAGNVIPRSLGDLGVGEADRVRHIAWDIGVAGLGALLAEAMDAPFVRQRYSRLVIDCNRDPAAADAMPAVSDGTAVPGNRDLAGAARAARVAAIHAPYQQAIADELARRAAGLETILVSLHSFTPMLAGGGLRPWEIGVLHDRGDASFARGLLRVLGEELGLTVGDNEPYRMDTIDYTVPRHAYPAGLRYVEIEVRQDLIGDDAGQRVWAGRLAGWLAGAV